MSVRIFLYELKHFFRFESSAAAVFVCVLALLSTGLFFRDEIVSVYFVDPEVHWRDTANGGEERSKFRAYEWFTRQFGTEMNAATAEKIKAEEFPALERAIEEEPVFARLGVRNLKEFTKLLDDYTAFYDFYHAKDSSVPIHFEIGSRTDGEMREIADDIGYALLILGEHRLGLAGDCYSEYYIRESDICRKYGVISYLDYLKMPDDSGGDAVRAELEHISRQINEDIRNGKTIPSLDERHDEYYRFIFCYRVLKAYELCADDRTAFMRKLGDYRSEEYDGEYAVYIPEGNSVIEKRVSKAAEKAGDHFFTVRVSEIKKGFEFSSVILMIAAVCVSVFLALQYSSKNRAERIEPVLYSAFKGYSLIKIQLTAAAFASGAITTLFLGMLLIFTQYDLYARYYDLPVSSFLTCELSWFDLNTWQYLALYAVFAYLVNIAFTSVALAVGCLCDNRVSAFAADIPLCVAAALLYLFPFRRLFDLPGHFLTDIILLAAVVVGSALGAVSPLSWLRKTGI